jgi:hypothetical protein
MNVAKEKKRTGRKKKEKVAGISFLRPRGMLLFLFLDCM